MIVHGRLVLDPARPPEPGWLRCEGGRVAEIGFGDLPRDRAPPTLGGSSRLIVPAFVDAHLHLPQIDSAGCDGLELLEWLDRVVFPAESWWGRGAAQRDARTAVRRLASEGTVGAAVYLSSHGRAASEVLALLSRTPMRWIAGRVAMDRGGPDDLTHEDRARAKMTPSPSPIAPSPSPRGRVSVSANPRFAIACSEELLAEIGWAVADVAARGEERPFVQTHVAESRAECLRVAELFPGDESYAHIYERFGLLSERTLLAHGVWLCDDQLALLARRGSVLVHCPTSNLFLRSGLLNLDRVRAAGVRLALGSDVAGGPDVAMPRVARAMIETAKIRALSRETSGGAARDWHDPGDLVRVPTPAEAWEMITRGNADALGWADGGRLEAGAAADLLVLRVPETWIDEHLIGRLIYNWSPGLIESRVFGGELIDPERIV